MKRISMIAVMLGMTSGLFGQGKVILHHSIYDPTHLPANGTFNWSGITHLIMFGSFLRDNASINYLQFNNTGGTTYLQNLIAEAHASNIKVLMCVAGDTYAGFFAATTDSAHCQTVVDAIMTTYYDPFDFDGVDLDWEGSFPAENWMLLSRIFRTALDARGGLLMADIGRGPSNSQPIWFINQFYDNVQAMIYDNNGWYSWKTGFHNALGDPLLDYPTMPRSDYNYANGTAYGTQAMERFIALGIDKTKLTPGLSFYSHLFYNNSPPLYAPNQNVYYNDAGGNNTTANPWPPRVGHPADFITAIYPRILAGYEQHWEPNAAMMWMGDATANFYISYQTGESWRLWNEYVDSVGLGGVMLFAQEHQYFYNPIEWPIGSGTFTRTPLLDDFRASTNPVAPTITSQPSSTSKYVGDVATFSVSVTSVPQYQWQKNSVNISGATSSSYTTPTLVLGDNASTFRCIVSNSVGTVTSSAATLTVLDAAPVVTTQPSSKTVPEGNTATFTVVTSGSLPKSYQWYKTSFGSLNESTISGATSISYTTPATALSDNGSKFRVQITNAKGTVSSDTVTLTVLTAVGPTSDDFSTGALNAAWVETNPSGASTLSFSGAGTADALYNMSIPSGTSYDAYNSVNSPRIMQGISNILDFGVEYKYQGALIPSANYTSIGVLVRGGSNFLRFMFAYDAGFGGKVYCNTNIGGVISDKINISIATVGVQYMRVVRSGNTWTTYYSFDGSTWNNAGSFTQAIVVDSIGLHTTTCCTPSAPAITASFDYFFNMASPISPEDPVTTGAPEITLQPTNQTATVGATATFTHTVTGDPILVYQWQKNGVNISGATSTNYTTPAVVYATDNGAQFRCITSNSVGTVISNSATLTVNVPATISIQPITAIADSGTFVVLSVTASGVPSPTYQWQRNTVNLTGETNSSYNPIALPVDSGASFRCIVTNSTATVTSSAAVLTVIRTAPNILSNPSDISVVEGETASFSITITGKSPYYLQWQKNGTDIAGATSIYYTTPVLVIGDNGNTYRCRTFSGYGTDTSASATLTVTAAPPPATAPTITSHPVAQTVEVGKTATFAVGATGTDPLAYQWQLNTVNISSATSASYTTPATVIGDDGGSFRCIVSNGTGTATSTAATLTVTALPDTTTASIVIQNPISGEELVGGDTYVSYAILTELNRATAIILPSGDTLGNYPANPGGGNSGNLLDGFLAPISFPVPFDSGSHTLVWTNGIVSDTSDTFHISYPEFPAIVVTRSAVGASDKNILTWAANEVDVTVTWKRDGETEFKPIGLSRNIRSDVIIAGKLGVVTVWPLSRPIIVRFDYTKDGVAKNQEERIEKEIR